MPKVPAQLIFKFQQNLNNLFGNYKELKQIFIFDKF